MNESYQVIICKECKAIIDLKNFPECTGNSEWQDRICKLDREKYTTKIEIGRNISISKCICNNTWVHTPEIEAEIKSYKGLNQKEVTNKIFGTTMIKQDKPHFTVAPMQVELLTHEELKKKYEEMVYKYYHIRGKQVEIACTLSWWVLKEFHKEIEYPKDENDVVDTLRYSEATAELFDKYYAELLTIIENIKKE